jgi:hypothetical protein
VKGYLLPTKLNPAHDKLSPIHRDRLLRSEAQGRFLYGVQDVNDTLVLICGHGGRDMRCGVMGPALRQEFGDQLLRERFQVLKGPVDIGDGRERTLLGEAASQTEGSSGTARVGLISHIGGHKFAGNVILYIPPGAKTAGDVAFVMAEWNRSMLRASSKRRCLAGRSLRSYLEVA